MSQQDPHTINKRNFYRVLYPERERPSFVTENSVRYTLLDISEKGMCLMKNDDAPLEVGSALKGSIELHSAGSVNVVGRVIRDTEEGLAVLLRIGVPFSFIVNEQQYLQQLNKYID